MSERFVYLKDRLDVRGLRDVREDLRPMGSRSCAEVLQGSKSQESHDAIWRWTSIQRACALHEVHLFEGAGHGFLRGQSLREGANLRATQQAWPRTIAFLREHLE